MASNHIYPIVVQIDTSLLTAGVVTVPLGKVIESGWVYHVDGSLRALISGTFSVELRDLADDTLISTMTWTSAGLQEANADYTMKSPVSGLKLNVTGLGIGASGCTVTVWMRLNK